MIVIRIAMTPSLKASSRLLGTSRGYPRQRGAAAARSRGIRVPPTRAESELAVDQHHLVGAIAFILGAPQIQRPLRRQGAYVRPARVAFDSTIAFRLPRVLEVDQSRSGATDP